MSEALGMELAYRNGNSVAPQEGRPIAIELKIGSLVNLATKTKTAPIRIEPIKIELETKKARLLLLNNSPDMKLPRRTSVKRILLRPLDLGENLDLSESRTEVRTKLTLVRPSIGIFL